MNRVVLEHVGEVVRFEQIVDTNDLDVAEILDSSTENHTTNTTKTVDTYFDCHDSLSFLKKPIADDGCFTRCDPNLVIWRPKNCYELDAGSGNGMLTTEKYKRKRTNNHAIATRN
jgi:hypothetical protein